MKLSAKIVNGFHPLTVFAKKNPSGMFDRFLNNVIDQGKN